MDSGLQWYRGKRLAFFIVVDCLVVGPVWWGVYLHIVCSFGLGVHHEEAVVQVLLGPPSVGTGAAAEKRITQQSLIRFP